MLIGTVILVILHEITACILATQVRAELLTLVQDLPATLDRISQDFSGLSDLIEYYDSYVHYTTACPKEQLLPMLKFLIGEKEGNLK